MVGGGFGFVTRPWAYRVMRKEEEGDSGAMYIPSVPEG